MPNNVSGENGTGTFGGFGGVDDAYGAVKRIQTAQQLVPIGSAPGVNAPKQARRHSQKRKQTQVAPSPQPVTPVDLTPDAWHAQAWSLLASDPDASELVRKFAAEYTGGV